MTLTTNYIQTGMLAFVGITGATSLVSTVIIVGTITGNLAIIILKSMGCLETKTVQFFLNRMKTSHFVNHHMGAFIVTSSFACALCTMTLVILSNLHDSTADREEHLS